MEVALLTFCVIFITLLLGYLLHSLECLRLTNINHSRPFN